VLPGSSSRLAFACAVVAAATSCAAAPPSSGGRAEIPGGGSSVPPAEPEPSAEGPKALPEAQPPSPPTLPPFATTSARLARFQRALYDLASGARDRHVRVLWLGDSHGQADFWSGELRRLFASRFGNVGPGFVHLGYKQYRHDDVRLEIAGKWRMRPKKPVGVKRQDDGVFGLGGLLLSGVKEEPAIALKLAKSFRPRALTGDLCYRLAAAEDGLSLEPSGASKLSEGLSVRAPARRRGAASGESGLSHHTFTVQIPSDASAANDAGELPIFRVTPTGSAALCGVVLETPVDARSRPGVVIDTLAINGARYGTMLAWDEAAWVAEAKRRAPDLVILELGTNEAGDGEPATRKIERQVEELAARARKANPEVDCVVVTPTDRSDAEGRVEKVRAAVMRGAEHAGCELFDVWTFLGGKGAMAKRREEKDGTVQKDGIHLTIAGYKTLAPPLLEALLRGTDEAVLRHRGSDQ
jgi:lysophospholipase L1-like esterase